MAQSFLTATSESVNVSRRFGLRNRPDAASFVRPSDFVREEKNDPAFCRLGRNGGVSGGRG
jgi:hypothetical protein